MSTVEEGFAQLESEQIPLLKLDLGCGPNKKGPDWHGVDSIDFDGVDTVMSLMSDRWPWDDGSVDEIHMSHVLEHFTGVERCHIANEMWRVLKTGSQAVVICPHWTSQRAYGDPTHAWPPIGGFTFLYMGAKWRRQNAPHTDAEHWPTGYACNFAITYGFGLHPMMETRNDEARQFCMTHYIETTPDIISTWTKQPMDIDV